MDDETMDQCSDSCMASRKMCTKMVMYCLTKGGKHADPSHIRLLLDCAEICETSADFVVRDSDYAPKLRMLCAEICDSCAVSCEAFTDDEEMKLCAEICRDTAKNCREMPTA